MFVPFSAYQFVCSRKENKRNGARNEQFIAIHFSILDQPLIHMVRPTILWWISPAARPLLKNWNFPGALEYRAAQKMKLKFRMRAFPNSPWSVRCRWYSFTRPGLHVSLTKQGSSYERTADECCWMSEHLLLCVWKVVLGAIYSFLLSLWLKLKPATCRFLIAYYHSFIFRMLEVWM